MKNNKEKPRLHRVWRNKGNNQKLVTVPADSPIEEGDYVRLIKVAVNK